jgi:hypothetical protein
MEVELNTIEVSTEYNWVEVVYIEWRDKSSIKSSQLSYWNSGTKQHEIKFFLFKLIAPDPKSNALGGAGIGAGL